jgi:hypothetical protein
MRVVIYPNDHRPAHVHVIGSGCEAVFNLRGPDGQPALRENYGFGMVTLALIAQELTQQLPQRRAAWRRIHGNH